MICCNKSNIRKEADEWFRSRFLPNDTFSQQKLSLEVYYKYTSAKCWSLAHRELDIPKLKKQKTVSFPSGWLFYKPQHLMSSTMAKSRLSSHRFRQRVENNPCRYATFSKCFLRRQYALKEMLVASFNIDNFCNFLNHQDITATLWSNWPGVQ